MKYASCASYTLKKTLQMSNYKAITLWEPYASLISVGAKTVETRSWLTTYRGKLLIHAAKRQLTSVQKQLLVQWKENFGIEVALHPGCIVAVCTLKDCVQMTPELIAQQNELEIALGDWKVGRYAWILENISATTPVEVRGAQGLWSITAEAIGEVVFSRKQLSLL